MTYRARRPALLVGSLMSLLLAASLAVSAPARAAQRLVGHYDVVPGLVRDVYRVEDDGGPNDVQVLRFRLDDTRVRLATELATGTVPGRESVLETARRLGPKAVAVVNASFYSDACPPAPDGDPCGLIVHDGVLVSENMRTGSVPLGSFALLRNPAPDGRRWGVGRPGYEASVVLPGGRTLRLSGIDRYPGKDELVAVNPKYGPSTGTPAGTREVVLRGVGLAPRSEATMSVTSLGTQGNTPIPSDGLVLSATGPTAEFLSSLKPEDRVTIRTAGVPAEWADAHEAVGAGPVIVKDGQVTSHDSWVSEGFGDGHHGRHPRTLVGFTAAGEALIVTVDGRQDNSVGMTTSESGELMKRLGAVDALMMDGGWATTMVVNGEVVNHPCRAREDCGPLRLVANSLVVWATG